MFNSNVDSKAEGNRMVVEQAEGNSKQAEGSSKVEQAEGKRQLDELRAFRRQQKFQEDTDKRRLELKMVRMNRANVRPPNDMERKAFFRESEVPKW